VNKTSYPQCNSIEQLRTMPDGAIIFLHGWTLHREYSMPDGRYCISDGIDSVRIYALPREVTDRLNQGGALIGVDMYVRITDSTDYTGYPFGAGLNTWTPVIEKQVIYHEITTGRCDCGAQHTHFPNHHSHWCSSQRWS
jgi:hypothetical protein